MDLDHEEGTEATPLVFASGREESVAGLERVSFIRNEGSASHESLVNRTKTPPRA